MKNTSLLSLQSKLLSIEANYFYSYTGVGRRRERKKGGRKEKKRKERSTQHRRSTAKKNPSWENFLKRMNSIYHTDGTLRVSERQKKIGRVREMRTDTGRYISRDAVEKKKGGEGRSGKEER